MHNILVVLIILFGLLVSNNCFKDLDFQQISSIVESSNVVNFNLRVKKTSRFSYGISGNIEILDDAIDKYMIEIKIFHSSNGNNQFRLYPMGFRNLPIKRFMNRQYRDYLMETLQPPVSELPYSSNPYENLNQQVKKGNFTVTNYFFVKENLPSILPEGLWKLMHIIRNKRNGNIVAGFKMLAVLY